jgi:hypothetical protein
MLFGERARRQIERRLQNERHSVSTVCVFFLVGGKKGSSSVY